VQLTCAHFPAVQVDDPQSAPVVHAPPTSRRQTWRTGSQMGAADEQSADEAQIREKAQRVLQSPPPQSTSVSLPVLSPSSQWLATHTLPFQNPDAQSAALATAMPRAHFAQSFPPQSTPPSVASFCPSTQWSATQT
jgi:hypothetical protein